MNTILKCTSAVVLLILTPSSLCYPPITQLMWPFTTPVDLNNRKGFLMFTFAEKKLGIKLGNNKMLCQSIQWRLWITVWHTRCNVKWWCYEKRERVCHQSSCCLIHPKPEDSPGPEGAKESAPPSSFLHYNILRLCWNQSGDSFSHILSKPQRQTVLGSPRCQGGLCLSIKTWTNKSRTFQLLIYLPLLNSKRKKYSERKKRSNKIPHPMCSGTEAGNIFLLLIMTVLILLKSTLLPQSQNCKTAEIQSSCKSRQNTHLFRPAFDE